MERDVMVREAGLRDGLQNVKSFFPSASKCAWITAEAVAGVPEIQVCSFVPASVIPQFTDAETVVKHARAIPGLRVSAYAPNAKGADRAALAGVHEIGHVVSASESHNQSNLRRSTEETMADFERIVELRDSNPDWRGVRIGGCVATAFGCTIEGPVEPDRVLRFASRYLELGVDSIALADTVGYANPAQVKALFSRLMREAGDTPVSAHFHDTRGLGLANVCAALDSGVRAFDACIGGLGGCPFAPGATGNIVTEDLVFMLEAMGLRTGIDLDALFAVREILGRELPNEPLHGAITTAKPPKGFLAASVHA